MKQVAKDATASYSICYDPGADNWDSKFHKVRVTLERKGIKLHAKQRYYALPDTRPEVARQQAALAAVYQRASDDPAIGLRATLVAGAGKTPQLQIRINPADLLLREEGDHFLGGVTLLVADVGAAGPIGEPALSNFNVNLTREQHDAVMKEGLPIAQDHAIHDSIQKLRIIVLDQGSNTAGSLTIPLSGAQ